MDGVIRYTAGDALTKSAEDARAGLETSHWVSAADFDERQFQGKQREVALQDRLTVVEQRIAELSAKNQQLSQLLGQTLAALNPTARLAKEIKVALNLKTEVSQ
ncbi:hypothetical protein [Pseudomonas sp. VE 196-7]|uniref:hypothetical protein n=1 Tax=Pseudomonas sp. VE 196-7 TaxID=2956726 RepID=UPI0021D51313|nr:hypothetical protein [Pseudomonas sp. VE 196-7]MCU7217827.1 hypothetical protein [Pseudomonas sp. VE 196-7]